MTSRRESSDFTGVGSAYIATSTTIDACSSQVCQARTRIAADGDVRPALAAGSCRASFRRSDRRCQRGTRSQHHRDRAERRDGGAVGLDERRYAYPAQRRDGAQYQRVDRRDERGVEHGCGRSSRDDWKWRRPDAGTCDCSLRDRRLCLRGDRLPDALQIGEDRTFLGIEMAERAAKRVERIGRAGKHLLEPRDGDVGVRRNRSRERANGTPSRTSRPAAPGTCLRPAGSRAAGSAACVQRPHRLSGRLSVAPAAASCPET